MVPVHTSSLPRTYTLSLRSFPTASISSGHAIALAHPLRIPISTASFGLSLLVSSRLKAASNKGGPLLQPRAESPEVLDSGSVAEKGAATTSKSGWLLSRISNGSSNTRPGSEGEMECIGTGTDVECVIPSIANNVKTEGKIAARAVTAVRPPANQGMAKASEELSDLSSESMTVVSSISPLEVEDSSLVSKQLDRSTHIGDWILLKDILETLLLISPFFFWGTAMVAMKGILPKAGPSFVAATRLIPAGILLLAFASYKGRKQPSGLVAWLAIALFGLIDASCFQGFLTEGLKRTSAGLGSVIIDSQPLSVAVLAAILFGENIGSLGVLGLITGIIGLLLLEVPVQAVEIFFRDHGLTDFSYHLFEGSNWTIWDSGEWWMLLAAQSMAVGTVMVRWVCQYSDPIMATGWHMILGGIPLLALSVVQQDPALSGHIQDLQVEDWLALLYTSLFGSAVSYGVFFYNATRGSLTKLSSLTFLTPMFAAFFGYLFLDETLTPVQLLGALVTLVSIYLVNTRATDDKETS